MATFPESQKKNCISEMAVLAKKTVDLAADMRQCIEKWQSFGITPADLIASGVLSTSNFDGLPADILSNFIGSMDNFVSTWYAAHGVNARLMTE
jgi:hypothetical protein